MEPMISRVGAEQPENGDVSKEEAVAFPQAMAYATIAGLPPQLGLYTAIVMTAVGALLDPTGKLINGPTNAISIALFSALAPIDVSLKIQVAVFLALLVGLIQTGIT